MESNSAAARDANLGSGITISGLTKQFTLGKETVTALDDANLGRLLEVLETLRETSQLIIVTHQKRTMEIADALYGVSMGKDGITRVVGQKLDKAG